MVNMTQGDGVKREEMDFDVVIAGGGPAGLACAIHLTNLLRKHNQAVEKKEISSAPIDFEDRIVVLEKGNAFGAHNFSGAVLDPQVLHELIPDHMKKGCPVESIIEKERVVYLSAKKAFTSPIIPSPLKNKGKYLVSSSRFTKWLAEVASQNGAVLLEQIAGAKLVMESGRVAGVQTDDKRPLPNGGFQEPGSLLKAKAVVLAEGSHGTLTKMLTGGLNPTTCETPMFELGVKEIYDVPAGRIQKGECIELMGFPFRKGITGGGFIYGFSNTKLGIGLIGHLASEDPYFDLQEELQRLKAHPFVQGLIAKGTPIKYGAKTLPCGGYFSIPALAGNGYMILGDSAGLVDSAKLKGMHMAMKSGMLAAEVLFDCLRKDSFTEAELSAYDHNIRKSWIFKDLKKSRNISRAMVKGFPFPGAILLGFQFMTGGANLTGKMKVIPENETTKPFSEFYGKKKPLPAMRYDDKIAIKKLTDVFLSGTKHDEKQKSHIAIVDPEKCRICSAEFHAPCSRFCPAAVYERHGDQVEVSFSNCLHCKTCEIKCPKRNIDWNLPEGGGGPRYLK